MNTITKLLTTLLFLFLCLQLESKTVNVTSAGTLSALLTADEKVTLTDLKLTGVIDARDFKFMRDQLEKLNNLDMSNVTIAQYIGTEGTLTGTKTFPANEIPEYAFHFILTSKGKATLKSVILPNNGTRIGNYAFFLVDLSSVVIPEGYKTIGAGAFKSCRNIMSLSIASTVTSIESTAFYECYGLTTIILPKNLTQISSAAFQSCINLTGIIIPDAVTSIGDRAFANCGWLTTVEIGKGVTNMGTEAFADCLSITKVSVNQKSPFVISTSTFSGFQEWLALLEVPIGCAPNYSGKPGWMEFMNVKEKEFSTALQNTQLSDIKMHRVESKIVVDGVEAGETVSVYSANGTLVNSIKSTTDKIILPLKSANVYILKIGNQTFKCF
jgi:hypothetical protein